MNENNQGRKSICNGFLIWGIGYFIWLVVFGLHLGIWNYIGRWNWILFAGFLFLIFYIVGYGLAFVVEGIRVIWKVEQK